jgi:hypothetical protein
MNLSRAFRLLVFGFFCVLDTVVISVTFGLLAVQVSGYLYDFNHYISDPVLRGDDLGGGLVVMLSAIGSLIFSVFISGVIHFYLFKKYMKEGNKK